DVKLSTPGRLSIGGVIDASGGRDDGGSITLDAGDIATTARLDVSARNGGGDGGSIALTASGSVSLQGPIVANSDCSARLGCDSTGGGRTPGAGGAGRGGGGGGVSR